MNNLSSVVSVFWNKHLVGRLALTPEGRCAFEYDASFISNGVSISPFFLPLRQELFIAKPTPFSGGFGVFDDSLPDGWGQLILDRYLRSIGVDARRLTLLQRLSLVGSNGRGALEYVPDKSVFTEYSDSDLHIISKEIREILSGKDDKSTLEELYARGGSPGGARPKIFYRHEGKEWLVKFRASNDSADIGKTEYRYSLLAKKCGIEMPETRLFENTYFGVERFDRALSGEKYHVHSAAGLLHADYRIPSLDYVDLLKLCRYITSDMEEVKKLYRQMVFNVVIGNKDDHAKNFAFIYSDNRWKLSPAYDLLPSDGFNGFHTTTVNGNGLPTRNDMLFAGKELDLSHLTCKQIMDEVMDVCRDFN